ncbi:ATP-binding protein [Amycolatopsis sp. NPDC059027]|uniref:ATP-binding protein n=1 Tax=Amycolatopsis sp. NPDC059027 TaxID=3346709 RepID=UPI00366A8638
MGDRLSAAVRRLREQAGLTQEELAERSGVSVRTLCRLETDSCERPRLVSLRRVAGALDLEPHEFDGLMALALGTGAQHQYHRAASVVVPRQLPAAPRGFTGRARELAALTRWARDASGSAPTVVITAIGGAGGIGKTWLALHWAHQHVDRFPDGQLYVDLRGFSPEATPLPPAAAVRGFLDALGVAPAAVPAGIDAQVSLYRSLTAAQRMLVMLDNAADAVQVAPLLPGGATCTVVITSRVPLTGLDASHGLNLLALDVLPDTDAHALLVSRLGTERLAAEPDASRRVLACCGGLPLALGVVAARARTRGLTLTALAAELADATTRLSALDCGAGSVGIASVLSWSYARLTSVQAEVFGLLGLAPGPDIGLPAAAALAGLSPARAREILDALEQVCLLRQDTPGRYRMHDLVRLYAADTARTSMDHRRRETALHRIGEFYLRTAHHAAAMLACDQHRADPVADTSLAAVTGYAQAQSWLETERLNLLALARATTGPRSNVWVGALATALWHFLDIRAYYDDAWDLHTLALSAARDTSDHDGEARALIGLGLSRWRRGDYPQAARHFEQACSAAKMSGNRATTSYALHNLASARGRVGRYRDALAHFHDGLVLARLCDDQALQGQHLCGLAMVHWLLGRHSTTLNLATTAHELGRRSGNRYVERHALIPLGLAHWRLGQPQLMLDCFHQGVEQARASGDRWVECNCLNGVGLAHLQRADEQRAAEYFRQALRIAQDIGSCSLQAESLNNLGQIARLTGNLRDALGCHRDALTLSRQSGEPAEQAHAHHQLGLVHHALGQPEQARESWCAALTIYVELDVPEAAMMRALLRNQSGIPPVSSRVDGDHSG